VDAVPGEPIVTIELSLGDEVFPYALWHHYDANDLSFLAWG
jgi:hypothetical protein